MSHLLWARAHCWLLRRRVDHLYDRELRVLAMIESMTHELAVIRDEYSRVSHMLDVVGKELATIDR